MKRYLIVICSMIVSVYEISLWLCDNVNSYVFEVLKKNKIEVAMFPRLPNPSNTM
jgi:hypothetical protein